MVFTLPPFTASVPAASVDSEPAATAPSKRVAPALVRVRLDSRVVWPTAPPKLALPTPVFKPKDAAPSSVLPKLAWPPLVATLVAPPSWAAPVTLKAPPWVA